MRYGVAQLSLVPGTGVAGTCDLCATLVSSLAATVLIEHERGGSVRFATCERCHLAIRRLAAATGGHAHFAIALEVGSAHLPERPAERIVGTRPIPTAAELIDERPEHVWGAEGRPYVVRVYGQPRADGTWIGWIEFVALDGASVLRTGSETTQSSREQVAYWASGLEALYFEGAFRRAQPAAAHA
jgi:hypothetical protein